MMETSNADRAQWALSALTDFVEATGVDTASSAICDLIANLLHLGRGRGFDPRRLIERSHGMMLEEFREDPEGDMSAVQSSFRSLHDDDGFYDEETQI